MARDADHAALRNGERESTRPGDVRGLPAEAPLALQSLGGDRRRRHPDDAGPADNDGGDDWWDEWDERTERLIELFDDPTVPPDDPRFYERAPSEGA